MNRWPSTSSAYPGRRRDLQRMAIVCSAALAVLAGIDLFDLSDEFAEAPALGVAHIVYIVGSSTAISLMMHRDRRGWTLAGALAFASAIAYGISRVTGLPDIIQDIGTWTNPMALTSLLANGVIAVLAMTALYRTRQQWRNGRAAPS